MSVTYIDPADGMRFVEGRTIKALRIDGHVFVCYGDDPVAVFWDVLSFLSWVAARCPHAVVTKVDEENGVVTMASGVGL